MPDAVRHSEAGTMAALASSSRGALPGTLARNRPPDQRLSVVECREALHNQADTVTGYRQAKLSPLGLRLDHLKEARFDVHPLTAGDLANGPHLHRQRQVTTPAADPQAGRPSCAIVVELQGALLPSARQRIEGRSEQARNEAPFRALGGAAILIGRLSALSVRSAQGCDRMSKHVEQRA